MPSNKTKEKPISPIGKPIQPVIDLKAICAEKVKNNSLKPNILPNIGDIFSSKPMESKLETDPIRAPNNPIPRFAKPATVVTETVVTPIVEVPKTALNTAQSRLLIKLREKYPQMSE